MLQDRRHYLFLTEKSSKKTSRLLRLTLSLEARTWELLELRSAESRQLWATKVGGDRSELLGNPLQESLSKAGDDVGVAGESEASGLESEASSIVALGERVEAHSAIGEVGDVDSSEGVDLAGVSTDSEDTWVHCVVLEEIVEDTWDGVAIGCWASIPVLQIC